MNGRFRSAPKLELWWRFLIASAANRGLGCGGVSPPRRWDSTLWTELTPPRNSSEPLLNDVGGLRAGR